MKIELLIQCAFTQINTISCCLDMSVLSVKVNDDRIILDKTVADQVSMWKSSRGLTDILEMYLFVRRLDLYTVENTFQEVNLFTY